MSALEPSTCNNKQLCIAIIYLLSVSLQKRIITDCNMTLEQMNYNIDHHIILQKSYCCQAHIRAGEMTGIGTVQKKPLSTR